MVIIEGLVVDKGDKWVLVRVNREVEMKVHHDGCLNCEVGSYVRLTCTVKRYKNKLVFLVVDGGGEDA